MDHPHAGNLPERPTGAQSKTLFMSSLPPAGPTWPAVLVEQLGRQRRGSPMEFEDPHAALTWCQAHTAGFVFFLAADPSGN